MGREAPARWDVIGVHVGGGGDAKCVGGGGHGSAHEGHVERGAEAAAEVGELRRAHLVPGAAEHELRLVVRELHLRGDERRRARRDRAQRLVPIVRPVAAHAQEALLDARQPHVAEEQEHGERRFADGRQTPNCVLNWLEQ